MEDTPPQTHCRCPRAGQHSQSKHGIFGYLRTRLPWRYISHTTWAYTLLLLVMMNYCTSRAMAIKASIPVLKPADMKTFQYQDRDNDNAKAEYYRYLNIDNITNKLYIGAMNYVIMLNTDDISRTDSDSVKATKRLNSSSLFNINQIKCESTHRQTQDFDCQNHIRSIIPRHDGKLEVCGTGANKPTKFIIDSDNLNEDVSRLYSASKQGTAICPPNPRDTCTVLYVKDGNPGGVPTTYSGTMMDFTNVNPVFYRPAIYDNQNELLSKLLRTEKSDTKWLNEPHFVASFDVGEYVYFFFRESAIEYMNCGKAIYSRVARVCKKDRGGERVLESRFTTYFKARLNCSIPGEYPFYFHELYDVFRVGNTFYGLFRTANIGLTGSAICAFSNDNINQAFEGPFKEQTESTAIWRRVPDKRVPNPRPGQCSDDSRDIPDNVLQFSKARPLMDESVSTETGYPIFYKQEVNYTNMVVQVVGKYAVYFLATDKGEIHKWVTWDGGSKIITTWTQFTQDDLPIQQMKLHKQYLYLSTDLEVLQIAVEQCSQYMYCTQCVQDPYCGWSNQSNSCQRYGTQLLRNVETELPETACDCKHIDRKYHNIKVHGDPLHLHCNSHCQPTNNIQWFMKGEWDATWKPVPIDEKKYFLTINNSLIVFNVSHADNERYECKSENVPLALHYVYVNDCKGPEDCWRLEFHKWCNEFDVYKKQFEEWQCLKDRCVDDNQCMPKLHADTCRPHE